MTKNELKEMLNHSSHDVREYGKKIFFNSNKYINYLLETDDSYFMLLACLNPNLSIKHISKILNGNNSSCRFMIIEHSNVNSKHIDKALNDINVLIRNRTIRFILT